MSRIDKFKIDLKKLLIIHGASLSIMLNGDTHGIYDEGIGVQFLKSEKEKEGRYDNWTETERLIDGYDLNATDV